MSKILLVVGLLLALVVGFLVIHPSAPPASQTMVYASGLDNPRGLAFGPDGMLYVAEAGTGGSTSTDGQCTQVVPPVGPYLGGDTARISRITPTGERQTVVSGLPSDQMAADLGAEVSGASALTFIGNTLYALIVAGCSHGNADMPSGVVKANSDGTVTQVADLSAFWQANPVAAPNPADFEPDGTPYSLTHFGSDLYLIEPNHGELDKVSTADGTVTRIADISASEGHIVPTSLAVDHVGSFYVSNLFITPYPDGSAQVLHITQDGSVTTYAKGLTMSTGIAFDSQGNLYVLEASTGNTSQPPFTVPDSGRVVRVSPQGQLETVVTGLTYPTAMTFGPDGALYISNKGFGFGPAAGKGEILRVTLH